MTGQVKGFALVPAESGFPSTFTKISDAYNCSGQEVQAERIATGVYEIKFLGSPITIAAGNVLDAPPDTDNAFISFKAESAGVFVVNIYNAVLKAEEDRPFSVVAP